MKILKPKLLHNALIIHNSPNSNANLYAHKFTNAQNSIWALQQKLQSNLFANSLQLIGHLAFAQITSHSIFIKTFIF